MTNSTSHKAIDLVAASADMSDKNKRLAKIIVQARDAHSAHTDLASAFDMITALPEATEAAGLGSKWANHAVSALITSAIVLYARATKSNSKHRATLDLLSVFTDDEKEAHEWICNLRNNVLAHYGPGETFNGAAWHEEKVLLPLDRPTDARVLMASRRVAESPEVTAKVKKQIHRAMVLAQQVIEKRDAALISALEAAMQADQEFADFLKGFVVDLESIFEGHPISETVLNGPRLGNSTSIVWASVVEKIPRTQY